LIFCLLARRIRYDIHWYSLTFHKDITLKFFDDLVSFYFNKNLDNSTVSKKIVHLKRFLSFTFSRGDNKFDAFKSYVFDYRSKSSELNIFTLKDSEYETLCKKPFNKYFGIYEKARLYFLLGCSTGLRYSDLIRIELKMIKDDFLYITTKKTATDVCIPLNNVSRVILSRWNFAVPYLSNAKLNVALHGIFKKLDFDEEVKYHRIVSKRPLDLYLHLQSLQERLLSNHQFPNNQKDF